LYKSFLFFLTGALAYAAVEGLILVLHQEVKHVARGIHITDLSQALQVLQIN
jgi:uncharacterized membrane protein (DUF4010 family)